MPTTEEWAAAILFNTFHIILCFLIIYYFVRFCRFRKSQALQKRYPPLVYLQTLCIFFYVVQCILYKFAFIYGENNSTGYILKLLSEIFYIFSSHGMMLSFAAKSYVIYFNINWAIQMQNSQWSVYLNSDLSSFWFLRHHNDFGSKRYIYSFVFIYYILVSCVVSFLLTTNYGFEGIITSLLFAIELFVIVFFWNKIPRFHDVYYIKKEIRICNYLACTALLLYIIWVIKAMFVGYQLWPFMIFQFLFGFLTASIALVANTYIFSDKCKHLIYGENPMANLENAGKAVPKIENTLCSDELLPLFFKHLSDEFSVEVLLAFVEFIQFQNVMQTDNDFMADVVTNGLEETLTANVVFSSELPESDIVYRQHGNIGNNIRRYLFIAHDLCEKYVSSGSEFEINISYSCNQAILHFVRNYCNASYWSEDSRATLNMAEKSRLFALYHNASTELYRLMLYSHSRFIQAILADKDFRVDTKQNAALKKIKSNKSLVQLQQTDLAKKGNIMKSLRHRMSSSGKIVKELGSYLVSHDSMEDVKTDINELPQISRALSAPSPSAGKYATRVAVKSYDDIAIEMDGAKVAFGQN